MWGTGSAKGRWNDFYCSPDVSRHAKDAPVILCQKKANHQFTSSNIGGVGILEEKNSIKVSMDLLVRKLLKNKDVGLGIELLRGVDFVSLWLSRPMCLGGSLSQNKTRKLKRS